MKVVSEWFQAGEVRLFREPDTLRAMGIDDTEFSPIVNTLEHIGAVQELGFMGADVVSFKPAALSLQLVREIEQKQAVPVAPPDIVEQFQRRARQNPRLAWIIIVALVLTVALSMIENLFAIIQRIIEWWGN